MKESIAKKIIEAYRQEPARVYKLLLQIDATGALLEMVAAVVREERDNAPLVKPQGEIVEREGWQV